MFIFLFSLEKNSPYISGFIYNFKDLEMLHKVSSTFMTFFFPSVLVFHFFLNFDVPSFSHYIYYFVHLALSVCLFLGFLVFSHFVCS